MPDSDIVRIAIFARLSPQKNPIRFVNMLRRLKTRTLQRFTVDWYSNYEDNKGNPTPEYLEIKNHIEECGVEDVISVPSGS